MLTRSAVGAVGMELGVVIERDLVLAMGIAEDVAAVTAMVAPFEEIEGLMACRSVADGGV